MRSDGVFVNKEACQKIVDILLEDFYRRHPEFEEKMIEAAVFGMPFTFRMIWDDEKEEIKAVIE